MKKEYIAPALTEDFVIETENFIADSVLSSTLDELVVEFSNEEYNGEGASRADFFDEY